MIVSIIVPENQVYIDRVVYNVDCSALASSIHAVQWNGEIGEVEFVNDSLGNSENYRPNVRITSLNAFQPLIDLALTIKHNNENPPALTKDDLFKYSASVRFNKQSNGFVSNTFGPVLSDNDTVNTISNIIQALDKGIMNEPVSYKSPNGFVNLTKSQLTSMAQEIISFIQKCFQIEKDIGIKIQSTEITTRSQIDQFFTSF